jgi:hypothetical protein
MAETSTKISGPVTVQSDCKERVAFDLMHQVSYAEKGEKDRGYYLTLYYECLQVVLDRAPTKKKS